MRKIILNVALSLDGYIEDANGAFDWCFTDQDYGMKAFFEDIDAVFYGRKSYELMLSMEQEFYSGKASYVFSKTLTGVQEGINLVNGDLKTEVGKIKNQEGKNIWLFGGASLLQSFLEAGLVDEINLAIHPILLGGGMPLFGQLTKRMHWKLIDATTYSSGLVQIRYAKQ